MSDAIRNAIRDAIRVGMANSLTPYPLPLSCTSIHNPHLVRASRSMDGRQAAERWSSCQ